MPDLPLPRDLPLAGDVPIALLPVRLETRFAGTTLQIRVYPDSIHIDSHHPVLTGAEAEAGKAYWLAVWAAADDAAEMTAWDGLTYRFGIERGAWIAEQLKPINPTDRPVRPPQFPTVVTPNGKSLRARVAVMPTCWRAAALPVGADDNPAKWVHAEGKIITAPPTVGPSPAFDPAGLPESAAPLDPDTRWLVDFDTAVKCGMAFTLPADGLTDFQGWARLFVYGVMETGDGTSGARAFATLLESHYYTDGFAFLPAGTPTNNTPGSAAALSRSDPAYRARYRPSLSPTPEPGPDSNAGVLTREMGMPISGAISRAAGAGDREQPQARWMNTALWQPTWGYFLTEMLGADVTDAQVQRIRSHVLKWLRPAGPLPALRVSSQPYGILPVLATAHYAEREHADFGAETLGGGFLTFLQRLRRTLWEPSIGSVPRAADHKGAETAVRILGMGAHAQAYYGRSLLGMEYIAYLWRFAQPEINLDSTWRSDMLDSAARLGDRLGVGPWDPRVGRGVFATQPFPVRGPIVEAAEAGAGATGTRAAEYLKALADPGMSAAAAAAAEDLGTAKATPLLYRLLRHGLLLEHSRAANQVRARAGLAAPAREPELIDIIPGPPTDTIWRRLSETRAWGALLSGLTPNQYWGNLAAALNQLASAQLDAHQTAAAVASMRRAAQIYEGLAAPDQPAAERDRYRDALVKALMKVMEFRSTAPAAAVAAGDRAVAVLRELAGITAPDFTNLSTLAPDQHWDTLANALKSLAYSQREMTQQSMALTSMGYRVRIYERLAAGDRPASDQAKYLPLLAIARQEEDSFR